MLLSFAKRTQLQAIIKTLFIHSNGHIGCATNSISSTTNGIQLSSHRFIFKHYAIENGDCHYRSVFKKISSRPLSTLDYSALIDANLSAIVKREKNEFKSVFPDVVRELSEIAAHVDPKYIPKRFVKTLEYNSVRNYLCGGVFTVLAFKTLAKPEMMTPENIRLAQYLGWCIEILANLIIVIDDIMDTGETRHGLPCWYKLDDVKLTAINDAIMMENGMYMLLKKHFRNTSYYANLFELFHEAMFGSCCGQYLDVQKIDVDEFTMERYSTIVKAKVSYYAIYLPISLAMHLAGYTDPEMFRQARAMLIKLMELIQIQDDTIDCFGNPNHIGKIGKDIENGSTTWLSVLCMQRANEEQKNIMRENYGKSDPEKVASIKKLYEELDLLNAYFNYEKELFNTIEIEQTPIERSDKFIKLKRVFFTTYIKCNKW